MKRLLVANRGEIAVRILSAARELNIRAIALYTPTDTSHIKHADEAIALPSADLFTSIPHLVSICQTQHIDAVHPGYGFLSESPEFATSLQDAGIQFIGPTAEVLAATGDKLSARRLAEDAGVPVLPALREPTSGVQAVRGFAAEEGWPVMLKAVDGGGGRGIRLVRGEEELEGMVRRAQAESPTKTIFAEKAMVDGCRHVEVQILGDGKTARHFWERECSIQRRYQKVVEIAPSTLRDGKHDGIVEKIIQSALKIANHIRYRSLGTFEFLASPSTGEYYFMEINPRLQVEHTITESIAGIDLVHLQLKIANGASLEDITSLPSHRESAPPRVSVQLRVTAEDPRRDFALSIGRINSVAFPGGNGVRVDTHIEQGSIVSADFDSLLAKIIVTAPSYDVATGKGLRALGDLSIEGVTTNLDLLKGILLSEAFQQAECNTQWLEKNLQAVIDTGTRYQKTQKRPTAAGQSKAAPSVPKASSPGFSIKKGDNWKVSISDSNQQTSFDQTIQISRLLRNDLPHTFAAEVTAKDGSAFTIRLAQKESTSTGQVGSSNRRKGDAKNPAHLVCPLSGQLVEMLVDEGDEVNEFDAIAIVRQMKMELEVRAHRKGVVQSIWDVDDGDNVETGMLVCEINDDSRPREKL